jgi:hypothetical protein
MAAGTAHIVFIGGSLTLPAQTPYDRQQLIDHVLGSARSKQQVEVRVDHTVWTVERPDAQPFVCGGCARRVDQTVCRRGRGRTAAYCVACALGRPQLTIAFLSELPAGTLLRDVQAHRAYAGEWIPWMRWPQATPAEIIDDMRLQRRFAPVLTWHCVEIRLPPRTLSARVPRARLARQSEEAGRRWGVAGDAGLVPASPLGVFSRLRSAR